MIDPKLIDVSSPSKYKSKYKKEILNSIYNWIPKKNQRLKPLPDI